MTENRTNADDLWARLRERAEWVWRETLRIHQRAPETRLASSLSPIELYVCLYYGGLLRFRPDQLRWEERDRFIVSKGHGSISLYPILADLGFFPQAELERVGQAGSFLGGIPDPIIPGYETVNGSLGHGLGVGAGMALALKRRGSPARVIVMVGDGELYEGAVWEAVMFSAHHRLDNLILIVDDNTRCMLNYSKQVLDIFPVARRFEIFGWRSLEVDGHDIPRVHAALRDVKEAPDGRPAVVVAHTVKGRGVPALECNPMCHIITLKSDEIDRLLGESADAS